MEKLGLRSNLSCQGPSASVPGLKQCGDAVSTWTGPQDATRQRDARHPPVGWIGGNGRIGA